MSHQIHNVVQAITIVLTMWFMISFIGTLVLVPLHFLSVEHNRLDGRFGVQRGRQIGSALGVISGWGYFIFLFGLWLSPQPRIVLSVSGFDGVLIPIINVETGLINLLLGLVFLFPGAWLGLQGVLDLGLETSETHRADELVISGIYQRMRHPQYLGAILSHIGVSLLLAAEYSILITPILILRDYLICKKEEDELVREFGEEYEDYRKRVPMLPFRL